MINKIIIILIVVAVLVSIIGLNKETFQLGDNYNNRYQHWENEFLEWNLNKKRESSSGPGSTINNTKNTLKTLNYIINNFNIKTLLDVPCGDINWIHNIFNKVTYMGLDISKSLINYNKSKYPTLNFKVFDIVKNIPKNSYDLVLCRDLLFHLSPEDGIKALKNIKNTGSKYLLTTTFKNGDNNNILNKVSGSRFYKINLQQPPFNLPNPIKYFKEVEKDKFLGLWDLSKINL